MKYSLIEQERSSFPLPLMCRVLGVSRSGYYKWRARQPSMLELRRAATLSLIRQVFESSDRTYGSPRIHRELKHRGCMHSRRFIGLLMRRAGIRARAARRRRPPSCQPTRSKMIGNVLKRGFSVRLTNRVWAADFTYIQTAQGWLYLAVVLDLASRRVVGWSMSATADTTLVTRALDMAIEQRRPGTGLLHHSDRGLQYSSNDYLQRLNRNGIQASFSRLGNCWDNAVVESFFHTLKVERVSRRAYRSRDEARRDLFEYIEVWYNQKRRHSTIGYLSPADYEARL